MEKVDPLGPEPIYRQVARVLAGRVESGEYPPRRAIPSEAKLCDEFDTSRNTVRAALRLLIEQGLVEPVKGKGVFVVEREEDDESR